MSAGVVGEGRRVPGSDHAAGQVSAEAVDSVDLSIVIPAYREERRIGLSLDRLSEFLRRGELGSVEVLVVVSSGPDATLSVADSRIGAFERLRVLHVPPVGKGNNVRRGMFEATGRNRVFMDADLATPLPHLERLVAALDGGADVVFGVRDLHRAHGGARRLISLGGNVLARALVVPDVTDTQCGFKGFTAPAAREIFGRQRIAGWGFDIEILAIARALDLDLLPLPIPDWTDVRGGMFTTRAAARAAVETFGQLLLIAGRSTSGAYVRSRPRRARVTAAPALVTTLAIASADSEPGLDPVVPAGPRG